MVVPRVLAQQLHRDEGLPELEKFQTYLSTLDPPYWLKVLSRNHPFFLIFRGPDAENKIILLKTDNHYDGYTTIMLMYTNVR